MNRWARALEVVEEVIEVQLHELLLSSRWRTRMIGAAGQYALSLRNLLAPPLVVQ